MFNVKSGILAFLGPMVSYRAFIQSGPRLTRGISNQEFVNATQELKVHYGQTMNVRVARDSKPTHIFIKRVPSQLEEWPSQDLCTRSDYKSSYNHSCHKSISPSIRRLLLSQNLKCHCNEKIFDPILNTTEQHF